MNGGSPSSAADPDTQLMREFTAGNEEAFDRIVKNFEHRVYGTIYRYVGSRAAAEDCAQEVFLRLYRMKKTYKPTARLSTLIYRITTNLCLNFIRDERRRRMVSLDDRKNDGSIAIGALIRDERAEDVSAALEARERAEIVRRALGRILPRQRVALVLHRFEGLSYAGIADVMETNVAAVKSLLSRARASLAEALRADIEAGNL
ncbi:MAG: RNA polymerase sigma factor [Planctomycetes bacterium]|nr:RNA polymerase sigma factor [Planctomycetota bacterium]